MSRRWNKGFFKSGAMSPLASLMRSFVPGFGLVLAAMLLGGCPQWFEVPPVLRVNPQVLNFGTDKTELDFAITNAGGGNLVWSVEVSPESAEVWLEVDPLAGDGADSVSVTLLRSELPDDVNEAELTVSTDRDIITVKVLARRLRELPDEEGEGEAGEGEGAEGEGGAEEGEGEGAEGEGAGDEGEDEGEGNEEGEGESASDEAEGPPEEGEGVLSVEPLELLYDPGVTERALVLRNNMEEPLDWSATASQPWITVDPESGRLETEGEGGLRVLVDRGMIPEDVEEAHGVVVVAVGEEEDSVPVLVFMPEDPCLDDREAPRARCQNTIVALNEDGQALIGPEDIDGGSQDNCRIVDWRVRPNAFSCDDLGEHEVRLTVEDAAGNTDSCTAMVRVVDRIAPVAVCRAGVLNLPLDENGGAALDAGRIDAGSTDNCGLVDVWVEPDVFGCDDLGEREVTLHVSDAAGNTDTCTAMVRVQDPIAPVAVCRAEPLVLPLDAEGAAVLDPIALDAGSADNCGIANAWVEPDVFGCEDLGLQPVTLHVEDAAGNASSCGGQVRIVDTGAVCGAGPEDVGPLLGLWGLEGLAMALGIYRNDDVNELVVSVYDEEEAGLVDVAYATFFLAGDTMHTTIQAYWDDDAGGFVPCDTPGCFEALVFSVTETALSITSTLRGELAAEGVYERLRPALPFAAVEGFWENGNHAFQIAAPTPFGADFTVYFWYEAAQQWAPMAIGFLAYQSEAHSRFEVAAYLDTVAAEVVPCVETAFEGEPARRPCEDGVHHGPAGEGRLEILDSTNGWVPTGIYQWSSYGGDIAVLAAFLLDEFEAIDTNDNSGLSYPEIRDAVPEVPTRDFALLDSNGDLELTEDELAGAIPEGEPPA